MNNTKTSFRLIIIRRYSQLNLFKNEEEKYRYTVIVSNRNKSAEEIVEWYNKRGEYSENRIKELKCGFGMERIPCGQFFANAVFFRIGLIAYNLFRIFQISILPEDFSHHQVAAIRWKLYQIAGKITYHSGQIFLKIKRVYYALFKEIRYRIYKFAYD